MTSMTDLQPLGGSDSPAAVLEFARYRKRDADQAQRDVMRAAATWVAMPPAPSTSPVLGDTSSSIRR
jgi:hypothetical protein